MKTKNSNQIFNIIFMFIGAICFGIVTFDQFYRNNIFLGILCLVITICELISFIINIVKYKKVK